MRVSIRHRTHYAYDPPAKRAGLRLKLFPSRFATQNALNWHVTVNGEEVAPLFTNHTGDAEAIWIGDEELGEIEVIAEGLVEVVDTAGVLRGFNESARPGMFLRSTALTAKSAALEDMARVTTGENTLASLHKLNELVRDTVDYVPDSTDMATSADAALKQKRGVCQDHAHIFVAAARLRDIPARYVTGYMLAEGEQRTHAWAEAWLSDLGWVGFDPANRQCPTDAYVRLCSGLDAADAAPLRGRVLAVRSENMSVDVDLAQEQ